MSTAEKVATFKDEFLRNVEKHELEILRDEGVFRHVRCRDPFTNHRWFEIVTWPNRLCITGDMGTYVFRRLPDMFEFFRPRSGQLEVNLSYWSEKIEASDRCDGVERFSGAKFVTQLREMLDDYLEVVPLNESKAHDLRRQAKEEIFDEESDDESFMRQLARHFDFEGRNPFEDHYEFSCTQYTLRFNWCCHAIVWAILQYDKLKELVA